MSAFKFFIRENLRKVFNKFGETIALHNINNQLTKGFIILINQCIISA